MSIVESIHEAWSSFVNLVEIFANIRVLTCEKVVRPMKTDQKYNEDFTPMEAQLRAHIGKKLRTLYEDVLTEAVPDRFTALLDRLEASERRNGSSGILS
jgi:hypothetical protein